MEGCKLRNVSADKHHFSFFLLKIFLESLCHPLSHIPFSLRHISQPSSQPFLHQTTASPFEADFHQVRLFPRKRFYPSQSKLDHGLLERSRPLVTKCRNDPCFHLSWFRISGEEDKPSPTHRLFLSPPGKPALQKAFYKRLELIGVILTCHLFESFRLGRIGMDDIDQCF